MALARPLARSLVHTRACASAQWNYESSFIKWELDYVLGRILNRSGIDRTGSQARGRARSTGFYPERERPREREIERVGEREKERERERERESERELEKRPRGFDRFSRSHTHFALRRALSLCTCGASGLRVHVCARAVEASISHVTTLC